MGLKDSPGLYKGFLTDNLDRIKKVFMKKHKFDWVNAIDGFERIGKSTLGIKMCLYMDPSFDINRVCFTPNQYMSAVQNAKKDQAVLYDEAITGMFSKEAMNTINITLTKMFAVIGSKRLFHCVILPNFLKLNRDIATRRILSLQHVYWRGKFGFYSRKRTSIIAELQDFKKQRPNFYGTFPNQNKEEFPWKKYDQLKTKYLKEYFEKFGLKDLMTADEITKIIFKVKASIDTYSSLWRGKQVIDRSLLQHDFGLSLRNAAQVKKVVERSLKESASN